MTPNAIANALKQPLKITAVKLNEKGAPSVRYIGKEATVVVNPITGKIITVWRSGTKLVEKLEKRIESLSTKNAKSGE